MPSNENHQILANKCWTLPLNSYRIILLLQKTWKKLSCFWRPLKLKSQAELKTVIHVSCSESVHSYTQTRQQCAVQVSSPRSMKPKLNCSILTNHLYTRYKETNHEA